jgi:hypothetical protein
MMVLALNEELSSAAQETGRDATTVLWSAAGAEKVATTWGRRTS